MKKIFGIMALLLLAVIAMPVSAEEFNLAGNVAPQFSFSMGSSPQTWNLIVGSNDLTTTNTVVVASNVPYVIKARDAMGTGSNFAGGHMKQLNAGGASRDGTYLLNAVGLSLNSVFTPISDTDATIHSASSGTLNTPLKLQQVVDLGDKSLSGGAKYDINIIVTGTAA